VTTLKLTTYTTFPSDYYLTHKELVDVLNIVVFGLFLPSLFFAVTSLATAITAVKLKSAAAFRKDQVRFSSCYFSLRPGQIFVMLLSKPLCDSSFQHIWILPIPVPSPNPCH
jgi:hypothetical protein